MISKFVLTFLLVSFTFIFLTFSFNIVESYGINETQQKNNDTVNFEKVVAQYLNWWINVPIEEDPQQLDNPCVIHDTGSVIFLHDPFEMGDIKNTCTIPHKSLFFPFYIGWCDNGNQGYYRTESYNKLLECTLDANRGLVTMIAYLDDKKIVDVRIDNTDIHNLKVLHNNSLDNYYKEIGPTNFFELTLLKRPNFKIMKNLKILHLHQQNIKQLLIASAAL